MPKPVNGQASWPDSLEEKYAQRDKLVNDLKTVQAEISALELVMILQEVGGINAVPETGQPHS